MNMITEQSLKEYFPIDYWTKFEEQFQHNFFAEHLMRTMQYGLIFEQFKGKNVLEIGGFPGLEVALLHKLGCDVECIDSPKYRPDYYLNWCRDNEISSISHDIIEGGLNLEEFYDVAIMSDVLLHINGFPSEFIKSIIKQCDKFVMINYSNTSGIIRKAVGHDLTTGNEVASKFEITNFFLLNDCVLENEYYIDSPNGKRDVLIFKCN